MESEKKARQILEMAHPSEFSKVLLRNFDVPVGEYMCKLREYSPPNPLECELRMAFLAELRRIGVSGKDLEEAISLIEHTRTLQTIAHTTLTNGPGFLGANWLASLGGTNGSTCISATISGIPFNNESRPGCLNFGADRKISDFIMQTYPKRRALETANQQRAKYTPTERISITSGNRRSSVYSSLTSDFTKDIISYFSPAISKYVSKNINLNDFTAFALSFSSILDSEVLNRKMIYLDLCSVVAKYLYLIFENESHPITRFCFNKTYLENMILVLGNQPLFSNSGVNAEPFSQFFYQDSSISNGSEVIKWEVSAIRLLLLDKKLCPSLFLTYMVISFVNGFQCYGGFNQVEYLKKFKTYLCTIKLFADYNIDKVPTDSLTVGRILDVRNSNVYPLDTLFGKEAVLDPQVSFGKFATPTIIYKMGQ